MKETIQNPLAADEALLDGLQHAAFDYFLKTVNPANGLNDFYYHFLDMHSGARVWRSELSMIDTALLMAGMLTADRYFTARTPEESELRERVETLCLRVDWRWPQGGAETVRMGWKPESGFLNYGWDGYNESIVLYVLALGPAGDVRQAARRPLPPVPPGPGPGHPAWA